MTPSDDRSDQSHRAGTETLTLLGELVRFDTVSRRSNLECVDYVVAYLRRLGVHPTVQLNTERSKANVVATVGEGRGGIALAIHSDVVPVDHQTWTTDPFSVTERNGRLYGRGTCDAKSFAAAILAAVPRMMERRLQVPIHIFLTYDEESGAHGARQLAVHLETLAVADRPRFCIVGEPSEMRVLVAHKGRRWMRTHVTGRDYHSADPTRGVNAVEAAARVIAFIAELARDLKRDATTSVDFELPYSTMLTTMVTGGVADNIVPGQCQFDFEIRYLPGHETDLTLARVAAYAEDQIARDMRSVWPDAGFSWKTMSDTPGFRTPKDSELIRLALALTGQKTAHTAGFVTEAGIYSQVGLECIICGPGSIAQAHQPDEFVTLDQVARCDAFLIGLLDYLEVTPMGAA